MKRLPYSLLLALALLVGCESGVEVAADEELSLKTVNALDILPPDVQLVGMADMQELKANESFPLFDHLSVENLQGEEAARVRTFLSATGFDPDRDLREVYFAIEGMDRDEGPSVVAYANFDRDRVQTYVDQNFGDTFAREPYNGVTVYVHRDGDEEAAIAFVNDAMILASPSVARVHAMIDRVQNGGRALRDDAATMALLKSVGDGDAWVVMRELPDGHRGHSEMSQLNAAIGQFAFSVDSDADGFDGNVVMTPREGVSAGDLADLTKGAVALARSGASKAEETRFLDDVDVRTAGEQVRVRFHADNALFAQMR